MTNKYYSFSDEETGVSLIFDKFMTEAKIHPESIRTSLYNVFYNASFKSRSEVLAFIALVTALGDRNDR